jgi:hypothetical protein
MFRRRSTISAYSHQTKSLLVEPVRRPYNVDLNQSVTKDGGVQQRLDRQAIRQDHEKAGWCVLNWTAIAEHVSRMLESLANLQEK